MRNLKKFLALVLAMMMAFSLMVTVNASASIDFTDAESITDEFSEAVAVLEGLEVFEGYPDGTFKPKNNITRAEVAAIVYRLATGDTDGSQAHLYKDYATFTDVSSDFWEGRGAGYINYCANAEWIAGYGNGKFGPNDPVTGYQAAAMILRAVGYGKNNEFVGSGWQVQVANFTRTLGLLDNVNNTTYANTLNQAAPRELVAEILFQAGLKPTVTWTPLNGYQTGDNSIQGMGAVSGLAWQNFRLGVSEWKVVDKWGRPGYYWFTGTAWKADLSNTVATIKADPAVTYDTAVKECDVAHDLEIATNDTFELYVNRNTPITKQYLIEATDTVTRVGGQGRVTEFYETLEHPWNDYADWPASVVMIDTYLATVTRVTERVVDPAGHEIYPSYLYLDVHDGQAVGAASKPAAAYAPTNNTSAHIASKKGANWEYAVGDKVLVQGYTDYRQANASATPENDANNSGLHHLLNVAAANKAAFETNILGTDDTKINVVQKAEFKTGKQTVTYWNTGKHTVDGTDYNDQMTLFLDVAGTTTNTTFAWYFDTKGNLIGIDNVPNTVNYGVITSIYSALDQGDSATSGTAKAIAKVLYADGTEGTITIDRFLLTTSASGGGHNDTYYTTAMNDADTATPTWTNAGVAELLPVYDNSSTDVMKASERKSATAKNATAAGWLHVAPVTAINAVENGSNTGGYFGILKGNMFKFVASADGNMTAIEVAGTTGNTGIYKGNRNNTGAGTGGKIYKSFGYVDLDTTAASGDIWMDADTRIMVNDGTGAQNIKCYTLSTLPGNVDFRTTEIDWADTDGDDRADYIYVTGTVEGTVTYGLFYYNGGAAQWNGVDKKGTIFGWLNGEATTINFDDETEFNAVKNSQDYAAHLFALQLTNSVVSDVMVVDSDKDAGGVDGANKTNQILRDYNGGWVNASGEKLDKFNLNIAVSGAATPTFGVGSVDTKFNNPYTTATEMIYVEDVAPNATTQSVSYDPSTRTIIVWTDNGDGAGTADDGIMHADEVDATYYLTPGSKVIGLGMGVNQESAILDYLNKSTTNDVTIVYEQSAVKSIVEIYVATDPNVTPGTGTATSISGVNTMTVTSTDDASLANSLKIAAALGNRVLFDKGTGVFNGDSIPGKTLFFPFLSVDASAAVLRVWDKSTGEVKWAENMPAATITTAGTPYAFYFDFTQYRSGVTAIVNNLPLTPGATYVFSITQGTTVVSSGEFTVN